MKYVKVARHDAEEVRKKLINLGVFDPSHVIEKDEEFVYFPVVSCPSDFECVEMEGRPKKTKPASLKEALKGVIPDEDINKMISSFDIIGDIAIIQIARGMEDKAELIADALMKVHPHVKVVCQKLGPRQGTFRVVPLRILKGENRFTTIYKENGVKMKVDLLKAYFSPRLSHERERVAGLVRNGEVIAALFAGVGPYPLVIAKRKDVKIYAVELNPYAYNVMVENIKLNNLEDKITPILGDVREVVKDLPKCDRILMPLPKGGESFLEQAFQIAKPGAVVHFYQFAPEDNLYGDAISKIHATAKKLSRHVEILNKKIVVSHKTRVYHIVIDFKIL